MNSDTFFPIGVLAQRTECKIPTIRYYEKIALLPEPSRTEGNQRRYSGRHLNRLHFIRHARELGFSLEDIRELIRLSESEHLDGHDAEQIARHHLLETRRKIGQLQSLADELERMVSGCTHDADQPCRVLEVLADHQQCSGPHRGAR